MQNLNLMARIFISYKRKDKEIVFPLKDRIEATIGEPCCIDEEGIKDDDLQWQMRIIEAIKEADVFLYMYSKTHTMIADYMYDWTCRELTTADHEKKRIIFVHIDQSPLTDGFELMYGRRHQVDVTSQEGFDRLIEDIKTWLGIEPTPKEEGRWSKTVLNS